MKEVIIEKENVMVENKDNDEFITLKSKNIIKNFEVCNETNVFYLFKTLLEIINRWNFIRIYVYNIREEKQNDKE